MSASRGVRFKALLLVGALLAALIVPSVAVAAVGGPYSESASNPDDNIMAGPSGGSLDLHGVGTLVIPEDALAEPTSISGTVWNVRGGPKTPDGAEMRTLVELKPDGTVFANPVALSFTIPGDIDPATATIYGWNPDVDRWESRQTSPTTGRRYGDKVVTQIEHFSWYGIGGTPIATTSTPASSDWSIALGGIVAMGMVVGVMRRRRLGTA